MCVKAVDRTAVPDLFNDDVFSVVAVSCVGVDISDGSSGNSMNYILRIAGAITFDRFDIDTFVKFCPDNTIGGAAECPDKTIFPCGPWSGCLTFENPMAIHVELVTIFFTTVDVVIDGREAESRRRR